MKGGKKACSHQGACACGKKGGKAPAKTRPNPKKQAPKSSGLVPPPGLFK